MVTVTRLTLKLDIMVNYFKYFLLLTSSIILLTSCQEGGDAGKLLGQWRMTESHYISFSGSVTRFYNAAGREVFGNFQHTGDSLFIQCYSAYQELSDTIMVEESFGFKPFNNIRVKIAALDNEQLVITKGSQTWSFHKY